MFLAIIGGELLGKDKLIEGAKMYLEFYDNCLNDEDFSKTYGSTITNRIACLFSEALKEEKKEK